MKWEEYPGVRGKSYWILERSYREDFWEQNHYEIWFNPTDLSWMLSHHLLEEPGRVDRRLTEAERDYYLANPDVFLLEEAL